MTAPGGTALVIDDDADIREVLSVMLESAGFQVDTFSDGIDALSLTKWYDVVLLDWKMPVFDGRRLTDYWSLTDPGILQRVIVLTGYSRLATELEASTFVTLAKPFDFKDLIKVVGECVANAKSPELAGGADA